MLRPFCNEYCFSDVHPFEVVRRVSSSCVVLRKMRAELAPDWKPNWIPGGFAGHVTNQDSQRWNYASDPEGEVVRVRFTKNGWAYKRRSFVMESVPRKFHDYNF